MAGLIHVKYEIIGKGRENGPLGKKNLKPDKPYILLM